MLFGRLQEELLCHSDFNAIGFAILIGGLITPRTLVHMPAHWIVVGAIVLLGVGILSGVKATRQKDPRITSLQNLTLR